MRMLVTGDWHIGARTWGIDRLDEAREGLRQISCLAEAFRVECIVVLGDVFDHFRYPGEDAVTLVASSLRCLLDQPQRPTILLLKGNHDWSGIKVWEILEGENRLKIISQPTSINLGPYRLLLVPYLRLHQLPPEGIIKLLEDAWAQSSPRGIPIAMAHLAIEGSAPADFEVTLPIDSLAELGIETAICGHIHRHGDIPLKAKAFKAFYCGPLFRLDFAEEGQPLGCFLIEEGSLRAVRLEGRPLKTLKYADENEAMAKLESDLSCLSSDAFVRVALKSASLNDSQLFERFRALKRGEQIVTISALRPRREGEDGSLYELNVNELWKRYVGEMEQDDVLKDMLCEAGISLLHGDDPSMIWERLCNVGGMRQ